MIHCQGFGTVPIYGKHNLNQNFVPQFSNLKANTLFSYRLLVNQQINIDTANQGEQLLIDHSLGKTFISMLIPWILSEYPCDET